MRSIFIFALVLLMASVIYSQDLFRVRAISPDPAAAVDEDDVTIVISGDFPNTGCRLAESIFAVDGDTLHAELIGYDAGGGGQMVTHFTAEYRWGELLAGDYFIHAQLFRDYNNEIELAHDTSAVIRVEENLDCYPNLVISDAWLNQEICYFPVNEIAINYVISNIGEHNPAGVSQERIYYPSTVEGFNPDDYHFWLLPATGVDSIHAGDSVEKNDVRVGTIDRLLPGEHLVIVQADGDQNVVESDDNDNWRAIPFTVVDTIDHHHTFVAKIETTYPARSLEINEDRLYVVYGDSCGLGIFDVSNPENPVEFSHIHFGEHLSVVKIQGNIAYVEDWRHGVYLVDIEQPESPELLSYIELEDVWCFTVCGDYLYAGGNNPGLSVYNLTNASDPDFLTRTNDNYQISCLLVKNENLIAWSHERQCIYSLNPPHHPEIHDCLRTDYSVTCATFSGNTGFLSTGEMMRIVDFSNTDRPVELSRYVTDQRIGKIAVDGNFAYLTNFGDGLLTLNVADVENVQHSGEFYSVESTECVGFIDEYVFLANNNGGVVIVRNDLRPSEVDAETEVIFPTSFSLSSPYPNPFNSTTTIRFSAPQTDTCELTMLDITGRVLDRIDVESSEGSFTWTAPQSGVYIVRLASGDRQMARKLVCVE